jgi:polysaccharide pyruvyl transferase WcaK-like protein
VPVRIVIDPSGYHSTNIGDAAMLETAVERLRAFWPGAEMRIIGFDREALGALDVGAELLDPYGARAASAVPFLPAARLALLAKRRDPRAAGRFRHAIRNADLVLVSGAGHLNDLFRRHAGTVLHTLELAIECGAATALTGQGLGPMRGRSLRRRAAGVLPRVDFISLREGLTGPPLLEALGVASARVRITGDDAIAIAFRARRDPMGAAIGVNLRSAPYAGLDDRTFEWIGRIITEAGKRFDAPLVPIPIARDAEHDDLDTVCRVLNIACPSDGPRTPSELVKLLPECRIVIAGSYHAAVLALSMGVPAVMLARSDYYVDKFRGLASQFKLGSGVVLISDEDSDARLRDAIDEAWNTAEAKRGRLLDAASEQIGLGEAAYRALRDLVDQAREARRRA